MVCRLAYYSAMGFYVVGEQGQKYGPADVATLNQWIVEGRLVSHTMLEDETSGGQARSIGGSWRLNFAPTPAPPPSSVTPPLASNYPRYGPWPTAVSGTFAAIHSKARHKGQTLAQSFPFCWRAFPHS